jgi:dihydroorotase
MLQEFQLRRPDDFHVHLRQDEDLPAYVRTAARQFARALVMPNLLPPIVNGEDVLRYRDRIRAAGTGLEPLMAFKVLGRHKPEDLVSLKASGAVAGKIYPEGVTTNAEDGVRDLAELAPFLEAMQDAGLVLCLHGEKPGGFVLDRETLFLEDLRRTAADFPRLRIVLEHVSTAAAVEAVRALPANVAATITLHHLEITLDDVVGGMLRPHLFCKPLAKRPEDRQALLEAAFSGDPKFFFGSDSAPHRKDRKECAAGCAGVYTMPNAMECLVSLFEKHDRLDRLEDFVASFGADFYGLSRNQGAMRLVRESTRVADLVDGAVPYRAGQILPWRLA